VDLHPQTDTLPPELTLGAGALSVTTAIRLCVACETRRRPDRDPEKEDKPNDADHDRQPQDLPTGRARGTCFELEVFAVGHLERTFSPDGVFVAVDEVEIVDIKPVDLEAVLECLVLQIMRAVLADVVLPLDTLRAGAFSLSLTRGPEVENDQIEVYGNL
jgi:hypothetical protein